jgi:hypothetical protein
LGSRIGSLDMDHSFLAFQALAVAARVQARR